MSALGTRACSAGSRRGPGKRCTAGGCRALLGSDGRRGNMDTSDHQRPLTARSAVRSRPCPPHRFCRLQPRQTSLTAARGPSDDVGMRRATQRLTVWVEAHPRGGAVVCGGVAGRGRLASARSGHAERRCPTSGRVWSTFGPHAIGAERPATVSSGTSLAQVAGAILGKQTWVENPDKDEGEIVGTGETLASSSEGLA